MLEGKLIQLRVRTRVRVEDKDARATYAAWVKEQSGPNGPIDLRILVLQIPKGATPAAIKTTEALAQQIVQKAKAGTDFCALVKQHGQDAATASTCGSRGPVSRTALFDELAKAAGPLKPGEVSAPLTFTDPSGGQAVLVLQRAPAALVPACVKVRETMMERTFVEATERERKTWLKELRGTAFIEILL